MVQTGNSPEFPHCTKGVLMSEKSKDSEIEKEPRQINFPSIMSIKEAACYLTISTYFLYGLVKAGCVPYAKNRK